MSSIFPMAVLLFRGSRLLKNLSTIRYREPLAPFRNFHSLKTLQTSSFISRTRMEKITSVGLNSGFSSAGNGRGGSNARVPITSKGVALFPLSPSSALKIQKGDITQWFVNGASDAIVNAANMRMLGGGGVDGAIHRAAGPELRAACYDVPEVRPGVRCPTGEARITLAFRLPVFRLIHTVGPVYDVEEHPEVSLKNAHRSCLKLAKENSIQYIAFPALSCGVYGYPLKEAATIAISTIKEFADDFKEVYFVLFSDDIYSVWLETANELL